MISEANCHRNTVNNCTRHVFLQGTVLLTAITGEGSVMRTPNRKLKYALISITVSFSCEIEKFVWSPPSVSAFNRCVAISRSWGVRNHADSGPAGIIKKNKTPKNVVRAPQMMNIAFHWAMAIWSWPMPYIIKAPRTWASPLQLIHRLGIESRWSDREEVDLGPLEISYPMRSGCSLFLYQILVSVTKAGETAPSANPRAKRTPMKDENVVAAARHCFDILSTLEYPPVQ